MPPVPDMFNPLGSNGLPAGWKKTDSFYQNGSTLFLDIVSTDTNKVHGVFYYDNLINYHWFFSAYASESTPCQRIISQNSSAPDRGFAYFNGVPSYGPLASINLPRFEWNDAVLSPGSAVVNGTSYAIGSTGSTYLEWKLGSPINTTSSPQSMTTWKLFEIEDEGKLKCKLIPAIDPDGVTCLYDVVRKIAFYNPT